jgi:arsenate reductase (thioredoxin)
VGIIEREDAMEKTKVLFVCVHNSARSQMAEAFMNTLCGDQYEAESAGLEPTELNPLAIEVMKEIGIDISKNSAKSVFDFYKQGRLYSFVITVCDEASAQMCPLFPGITFRLHWSFEDPTGFTGSYEERLNDTRRLRDTIKEKILAFCSNRVGR